MNYLPNSKLIKRVLLMPVMILMTGIFFAPCAFSAETNPFDETIKILERRTSTHWGQDCFVWIVNYPEELTDSWVESEAIRAGMTDAERERFRKNFISDLRLDTSETFLVSVYSFGNRPVNLSPVNENISLLSSSGERIKPLKYDSSLDNPSAGVIQGLVFFPKQINKDYVIGLKGMGRSEKIFEFPKNENKAPEPVKQEKKLEVVVVNLPKKQPKKKPEPVKEPELPPPPMIPPKPIQPLFTDTSSDMADFVKSVKNNNVPSQKIDTSVKNSRPSNIDNAYSSRETVLRKFLMLWADNSPLEMYEMLSDTSKKVISRENFAKEVSKASDIRAGLKSDYRIDWVGEERAKIITTHKTLFFKSVATRTLGITREGGSWKIIW